MTNEERDKTIEQIERIQKNLRSIGETVDYLDFAIQALEAQPTDMTIDEAIEDCEENDYGQIADWLRELKAYKEAQPTDEIKEAYLKGYDYGVKDWFKSKTQPCEDAVSRETIRELTKRMYLEVSNTDYDVYSISDCVSYVASKCRQYIDEHILDLPSVTPQRPKGKWIEYEVDVAPHPLHCSLCGFSNHHISNRYMREFRRCPNCGAEMSGGEESECI